MALQTVSCVIPAWNSVKTIGRAIESVLRQTVAVSEIVVVDDGSTDQTSGAVAAFAKHVRLFRQANAGSEAARNRGIVESTGEFIALLDNDDAWMPLKIEKQLTAMRERPRVGVMACLVRNTATSDDPASIALLRRYGGKAVPGWQGSDVMIRRSAFERVGNFNVSLRHSGMTDWLQRCSDAGVERYLLAEELVERYLRPDSLSTSKTTQGVSENLDEYLMLAHRRIAAERARRSQQRSS